MKQPPWKDKWRALSDMKNARNAGQETTSEDTMTGQHGASAVITGSEARVTLSYHGEYLVQAGAMEGTNWEGFNSWWTSVQTRSRSNVWVGGSGLASQQLTSSRREQNGTREQSPSSSSTMTKERLSAVFKDVPFQINQKPVSTTIGDQPIT